MKIKELFRSLPYIHAEEPMMALTYDHDKILKAIKKEISSESKYYPYSDAALKDIIEGKHGIDCGNSRQIWIVRDKNDIPNRATRLWQYRHEK